MKEVLRAVKTIRNELKKDRDRFWENNKKNFENNIKSIIKTEELPKSWKVHFIIANFLSDKNIMPYDSNAWSIVNLIAATKKQGFEIMVLFNRAKSFLSRPALMYLVAHELAHVRQAAKSPKKYARLATSDNLSKDFEIKAEKVARKLHQQFFRQTALESILYCYDVGGWKSAQKTAYFLYKKRENVYSGGYDKGMTAEEYKAFLLAKRNNNIDIFIDVFTKH